MLTKDEYERSLERLDVLMGIDPLADSDEGRELTALVDEVLEYELEHYPMLSAERGDPRYCTDGTDHDWSGPLYSHPREDGIMETGPTCATCGMEFGRVNPVFP